MRNNKQTRKKASPHQPDDQFNTTTMALHALYTMTKLHGAFLPGRTGISRHKRGGEEGVCRSVCVCLCVYVCVFFIPKGDVSGTRDSYPSHPILSLSLCHSVTLSLGHSVIPQSPCRNCIYTYCFSFHGPHSTHSTHSTCQLVHLVLPQLFLLVKAN
jgi:hypothetical protein